MCNKHAHDRAWDAYERDMAALDLRLTQSELELPFGDLRPSEMVPVIRAFGDEARVEMLPWGWKKSPGGLVINVRSESRHDLPAVRGLTPCDAFYEYRGEKAPKSEFKFLPIGNEPMALVQIIRDGRIAHATCEPGPDVAPIHRRQPVLVPRSSWRRVLLDPEWPADLMIPTPEGLLRVEQVR